MIKYKDEKDKCYGIAGMAIGISIWNGENLLYKIDLDDEANDYITFTSDFYFSGNPALPPVESWHQTLKRYQMTIGMLIANMMCRAFPTGGLKYQDVENAIFETVAEEGRHSYQLDDDEIKNLFFYFYSYMERAFRNQSVREIARQFAAKLQECRSLTNYEVKELLGMLEEE